MLSKRGTHLDLLLDRRLRSRSAEQAGRMGRVRLPAVRGAACRVEQTDLERCEGRVSVETECLEGRNVALELAVCWVGRHASVLVCGCRARWPPSVS